MAHAHVVVVGLYEQVPAAQVPEAEKLFSVAASAHEDAGGLLHVTPLHGSAPTQALPWQPCAHFASVCAYEHVLSEHVPVDA